MQTEYPNFPNEAPRRTPEEIAELLARQTHPTYKKKPSGTPWRRVVQRNSHKSGAKEWSGGLTPLRT